jgi:hypothetical protein
MGAEAAQDGGQRLLKMAARGCSRWQSEAAQDRGQRLLKMAVSKETMWRKNFLYTDSVMAGMATTPLSSWRREPKYLIISI